VILLINRFSFTECAPLRRLGFGKARIRRYVHFYGFAASISIALILVRLQHRTAATAPPITNDNNDCLELIPKTANALANIPLGLKVELADYPVLRIFASWEGDPKLERSDEWREADEVQKGAQEETKNGADTDRHPLATLHGKNFRASGEEMDVNWFRGDVEQKLVVHLKRAGEEQESRRRKSARLAQALIQQG